MNVTMPLPDEDCTILNATSHERRAPRSSQQADGGILEPITVPKASDILAGQLRDLILSGKVPPGKLLPTERELVMESGLSRASVREALRVLEVEGLISTRPGRTGGSTVQLLRRESVTRSMGLFVRSHSIRLQSLLECRLAVEPTLAGLAAVRRTEAELDDLKDAHQRFVRSVDDVATFKRLNIEWHLSIARASHNEVLIAFMEAISEPIANAAGYQKVTTPKLRRETIDAHAAILAAIEAGDSERASARMAQHVGAYAKIVRTDASEKEDSEGTGSAKRTRRRPG